MYNETNSQSAIELVYPKKKKKANELDNLKF